MHWAAHASSRAYLQEQSGTIYSDGLGAAHYKDVRERCGLEMFDTYFKSINANNKMYINSQ